MVKFKGKDILRNAQKVKWYLMVLDLLLKFKETDWVDLEVQIPDFMLGFSNSFKYKKCS